MLSAKNSLDGLFSNSTELCDSIIEKDDVNLLFHFTKIIVATGAMYGFTMGLYNSVLQAFISAIKVPCLFFVTLIICIPTLHFMGLFLGSKLRFIQSATILLWAIAITSILLAAFAPISLFFLMSHSSYNFIMLMHVVVFAICGFAGLRYVKKNFHYVSSVIQSEQGSGTSRWILFVWMLLYMFVGCQMAYILSPFVGNQSSLQWISSGEYNFFTYVLKLMMG